MDKNPLSPRNDFVFKKLFGENVAILTDFLKAVLDLPDDEYLRLEVLDPSLRAENAGDKYCVLDVKLHTRSGHVIDIEIQVEYQKFIWNRIQFYTAKMLVEQAKSGDDYGSLPRAISILITDFILIRENGEFHNRFRLYDERTKTRFPGSLEINILEIPKVREIDASRLGDWMRFFAAKTRGDFMKLARKSPALAEAWGVIKRLSEDESARMIAEAREKGRRDFAAFRETGRQEGLREGEQKGRQEGLREGKREIVRNALREKLPLETIGKLTGLSLEEVEQLARGLAD
ncbi:MAG: Rpn family recombination-promoting nuclease/putative transposase [Planctomycetota bacterium]|nr:Rpn family recombination-promoting nuclease/putative transposase [Planctomycetota bacterium]